MALSAMMQRRRSRTVASPALVHFAVQLGSWVSAVKGIRKFGLTSVFALNKNANRAVVPLSQLHKRRPSISERALRRPFTFSPCCRATPGQTTKAGQRPRRDKQRKRGIRHKRDSSSPQLCLGAAGTCMLMKLLLGPCVLTKHRHRQHHHKHHRHIPSWRMLLILHTLTKGKND